jgi:hypothetical protein
MANPAAVIGLTYRATDIQNSFAAGAAAIFLEIKKGLNEPPTVRGTDTIVPGLAGRLQGTRVKDMVKVELEGLVVGAQGVTERSSFRTKVTAFRALFDPTISGSLVATLEDATTKTLTLARTTSVLWDQIQPGLARVNVELESTAGDWT